MVLGSASVPKTAYKLILNKRLEQKLVSQMQNVRSFKTSFVTALVKDITLKGLKRTFGNYNQEFIGTLFVR